MATYTRTPSSNALPTQYNQSSQPQPAPRRHVSKQRFVAELSQCLYDFVIQLLPTAEEMSVKEDVRKLLERLIRTLEPDSRLLSFGSTGNGFALRNCDMDLCCLIDSEERLSATDLVTMLGDLLKRETKFHVKPLPHARIPIVKLSLDPSPGLPSGITCDIGFENRLALENTRLLMCYAMIDPTRVRTMVLFLKVWSKRRKINAPYKGTLSSYGYVLLVIYFLVHVKNPPVLPNLQQMPPLRPIAKEDTHLNGYNVWFFDDIELLKQRWRSSNSESVAELLIDFFRYYAREFAYNTGVASIRSGLLKKDSKGWQNDLSGGKYNDARERNRLCIEDPFEIDFNVARCVTKDGLYTIRGEFMRASRILASRPERAILALAELCDERKEEDLVPAPPYVPPRLSNLPPQTPYTVGSFPLRPKGTAPDRLSPPTQFFEPSISRVSNAVPVSIPIPPEHMAARRSKWTSPPPPEASPTDHTLFEDKLGKGLRLATASTGARESEPASGSSPGNSEKFSDDERRSDAAESDDVLSVRSFTEGSANTSSMQTGRALRIHSQKSPIHTNPMPSRSFTEMARTNTRGRVSIRTPEHLNDGIPAFRPKFINDESALSRAEVARRSLSGSPPSLNGFDWPPNNSMALSTPLPPSPMTPNHVQHVEAVTIYYQTPSTKAPRTVLLHPPPGAPSLFPQYGKHQVYNGPPVRESYPSSSPLLASRQAEASETTADRSHGLETSTPTSYSHSSHSHSQSTSTITAPKAMPPNTTESMSPTRHRKSKSRSAQPIPLNSQPENGMSDSGPSLPPVSQDHDSPTTSSSGYATPLSPSPSSSPLPTALPPIRLAYLREIYPSVPTQNGGVDPAQSSMSDDPVEQAM